MYHIQVHPLLCSVWFRTHTFGNGAVYDVQSGLEHIYLAMGQYMMFSLV